MSSFKSNPLTTLLVIALLGMIVIVLILPDMDLPDTAFQRNDSLQISQTLSHQTPHASLSANSFRVSFQFNDTLTAPHELYKIRPGRSDNLSIQYESLRC